LQTPPKKHGDLRHPHVFQTIKAPAVRHGTLLGHGQGSPCHGVPKETCLDVGEGGAKASLSAEHKPRNTSKTNKTYQKKWPI